MNTINAIRQKIQESQANSMLSEKAVTLLAASKSQPTERIEAAIAAGIHDFGENRVQEALEKWLPLKKKYPHIRLHLIGPLQSNKVKQALSVFDVIQTLDRPKLVEVMSHELWVMRQKISHDSRPMTHDFFIQINTGEEPQKAGISPQDTPDFIRYCRQLKLNVVGLMCVPPADQMPAPHFALLSKLAMENGLQQLSMGMSNDFETAIRMGSSCVRIGTALFGERPLSSRA